MLIAPQIKKSHEKPISLNAYVQNLLKQGKVENKEFRITRAEKYDNKTKLNVLILTMTTQ